MDMETWSCRLCLHYRATHERIFHSMLKMFIMLDTFISVFHTLMLSSHVLSTDEVRVCVFKFRSTLVVTFPVAMYQQLLSRVVSVIELKPPILVNSHSAMFHEM